MDDPLGGLILVIVVIVVLALTAFVVLAVVVGAAFLYGAFLLLRWSYARAALALEPYWARRRIERKRALALAEIVAVRETAECRLANLCREDVARGAGEAHGV